MIATYLLIVKREWKIASVVEQSVMTPTQPLSTSTAKFPFALEKPLKENTHWRDSPTNLASNLDTFELITTRLKLKNGLTTWKAMAKRHPTVELVPTIRMESLNELYRQSLTGPVP